MRPELAKILADLAEIPRTFDMTRDGLGERLIGAATDGVKDTIAREEAPDGEPWDQLDPEYEAWKAEHYPGRAIGFLEGLMTSAEEVEGEPEITADEAAVAYGKTDAARELATWFQEGSEDDNQPPRPFFGLTVQAEAAVASILDQHFDSKMR